MSDALERIQALLARGALDQAREELAAQSRRPLSRERAGKLALLANRAYCYELCVRLLHKYVRPPGGRPSQASDAERAEYARALVEIGSQHEGLKLLSELDSARLPRVLLHQTYSYFRLWDWKTPLPLITRYLAQRSLGDDDRLRASALLALCQLFGFRRADEAREGLKRALAELGPERFPMAHRDALQVLVQAQVEAANYAEAREGLALLRRLTSGDAIFSMLAELWEQVIALKTEPDKAPAAAALRALTQRFVETGQWWRAQTCDFYLATLLRDAGLLLHLYFGSSYVATDRGLLESLGQGLPEEYRWRLGPSAGEAVAVAWIDADNGRNSVTRAHLKEGQVPQRLLALLASDFYRAFSVPALHDQLYRGEHYNPNSSPNRVHQAIGRLRRYLERNRLPLELVEVGGAFRLGARVPIEVVVRRPESRAATRPPVRLEELVRKLGARFPRGSFSAPQAAEALGVSGRSAIRHLKAALDCGLLLREGAGPSTVYRVRLVETADRAA